jgi:hypothetical protein
MADSSAAAPAEATSAAPTSAAPARRWPLAGVVAGGVVLSAAVHIALVGTVLILGARGRGPDPVKAVPVDVVTEEQLAALEKPDPKPDPKPEPPPAQQQQLQIPDISSQPPQPAKPPRAPSPQTQSGAAAAPAPPPPPPPPSPQAPPNLDAFAPPIAPSAAPATSAPPPPPPPAPTTGEAAQLAQMLGLPQPVGVSGGPPSDYKANLTADAVAGFASHVQTCWTPAPASIKDANITVFIRVRLKRDGSLAGAPEPLGGSASMQALTLLQNSLNALKSCSAYTALPADKYDEWRVLDLRFTPNGISTAAPVRGAAHPG